MTAHSPRSHTHDGPIFSEIIDILGFQMGLKSGNIEMREINSRCN